MSKRNARAAISEWRDDSLASVYLERVERETGLDADRSAAHVAAMVVGMAYADGLDL